MSIVRQLNNTFNNKENNDHVNQRKRKEKKRMILKRKEKKRMIIKNQMIWYVLSGVGGDSDKGNPGGNNVCRKMRAHHNIIMVIDEYFHLFISFVSHRNFRLCQ